MADVTKLSDIYPSLTVKINVTAQFPRTEIGVIVRVISLVDDPAGIKVAISGGIIGNVNEIIKSVEIAQNKIMSETNFSENKEGFTEEVMRNKVIPQTVQSFLNSQGGSVFIGVKDDPQEGEEKIVGLQFDRDYFESKNNGPISDEKFQDDLRSEIESSLETNLVSETRLGQLIDYDWWVMDGKMILEIVIPSSKTPVFYKNIRRAGKNKGREIKFAICVGENNQLAVHDQRFLDDFFIREGSHKSPITTFEEFTTYYCEHFKKFL
jgi:predicted HTH transcriptional regulator